MTVFKIKILKKHQLLLMGETVTQLHIQIFILAHQNSPKNNDKTIHV